MTTFHPYQSLSYADLLGQSQCWHGHHSRFSRFANVLESNDTAAHLFPNSCSSDSWQHKPLPSYLFQNTSQESYHLALKTSRWVQSKDALASDMDWEWHSLKCFRLTPSQVVDKTDTWRDWNVNQYPWSWKEISVLHWHRQISSRRRRRPWIQYHEQKHHLDRLDVGDMGCVNTGLR